MDLGPLRALALALNFDAHGVPATVTPPNEPPIPTRVIWVTPVSELEPRGAEFGRRDPMLVLALRRDEVEHAPRGTVILAPPMAGGVEAAWRVDGTDRIEPDHLRVIVVPG